MPIPLFARWAVPDNLEDVFVDHYDTLIGWAERLQGGGRAAAEDLVHDAFVRVALHKPNLQNVGNLEGYLFTTLRNVHLSQVRRRAVAGRETASALDCESAYASFGVSDDPQKRRAACQELALIVRYACLRKASSKAASILILRFFHGYYPFEIALLLGTTAGGVDTRLRMARSEVATFLANPERVRPFRGATPFQPLEEPLDDDVDVLRRLRQRIFDARTGTCPSWGDGDLPTWCSDGRIDTRALAHVVSCADCLDHLNRRLGLPLLAERDPSDMLGRGRRSTDGRRASSADVTGLKARLRARLEATQRQCPRELHIAVNGLFVGSHAVTGDTSEQRLKILVNERIGFIEVFSEHQVCLLYMSVTTPPDGGVEQEVSTELTGSRRLTARLNFQGDAPVLHVAYEDVAATLPLVASNRRAFDARPVMREVQAPSVGTWWTRFWLRGLLPVTTLVTLAVAVWLWATWGGSPVLAAEVLKGAIAAESASPGPGVTTRRVLKLEERRGPNRQLVSRQRIELWEDRSRGLEVRRLFDERSHLIAGMWTRADGTRTVYEAGHAPVVRAASDPRDAISSQNIWRHGPSASDFMSLAGAESGARAQERADNYLLTYRPQVPPADGISEVTLTVTKRGHHAVSETIALQENGEEHEFLFGEMGLDRLASEHVAPKVFEPDAVLLNVAPSAKVTLASPPEARLRPLRPNTASTVTFDRLELEATYLLHRAHLWLGARADVQRTAQGIHVTAAVASEDAAHSLEQSFAERLANAAVTLDATVSVDPLSLPAPGLNPALLPAMPAYVIAEQRLSGLPSSADRTAAIQSLRAAVLDAIVRRRVRLDALDRLVTRWPETRLERLPLESVVMWQVMLQEHVDTLRQQTELIRVRLAPLSMSDDTAPAVSDASPPLTTFAETLTAAAAIEQLAAQEDDTLKRLFAPCEAPCATPDLTALMRSFVSFEATAARFDRFYLKTGHEPDPIAPAGDDRTPPPLETSPQEAR